ncbi:MAG: tetratricopeptide repeat protein [Planctomycetota bacterium]|nr:MAG: tetratricopeptide repeat protein [Planctomycetota bacterium]
MVGDSLADRLLAAGLLRAKDVLPAAPRRLGRYRIEQPIGEGAFGCVYRAFDPRLQRHVAVKVLRGTTSRHLARFQREMQVLARLQHPNIVTVFDAGTDGDCVWFVMEYWGELSLEQCFWSAGGTFPLRDRAPAPDPTPPPNATILSTAELIDVLIQVCDACEAAHRAGVIHRDLKPANILLRPQAETADDDSGQLGYRAAVADFGVARLLDDEGATSGSIAGTPQYMAPEQFDPHGRVGPPTDVYAMGVILYRFLAGRLPFDAPDLERLAASIRSGDCSPPSTFRRGLPPALEAIALQALRRDPSERFPTAAALATALQHARRRCGASPSAPDGNRPGTKEPPTEATVGIPSTGTQPPPDAERGRRLPKRTGWLVACLLIGALLAAVTVSRITDRPAGGNAAETTSDTPSPDDIPLGEVLDAIAAVQRWETEFYKGRPSARTDPATASDRRIGTGPSDADSPAIRVMEIDPPPYDELAHAADRLQRALEDAGLPRDVRHRAARALGRAQLWSGRPDEAIATFEQAVELAERPCVECLWDRAMARWEQTVLARMLDWPDRNDRMRRSAADWAAVRHAAAADEGRAQDGLLAAASVLADAAAIADRAAFADAAVRLETMELPDRADRDRLQADLWLCGEHWSQAIQAYTHALQQRQWSVACYAGRSIALYRRGGVPAAAPALADAVAAVQFNPRAMAPYAVFHLLTRRLIERLPDDLRRGASTRGTPVDVQFVHDVRRILDNAARIVPDRSDVALAQAAATLLCALTRVRRGEEPSTEVGRAVELLTRTDAPAPHAFEADMLAGMALLSAARLGVETGIPRPLEEARNRLQAAAALRPDAAEAQLWLGFALLHLGERDRARDAWQRAIELQPALADQLGPRWQRLRDRNTNP